MPSTNVFDPTNYTALIPSGNPTWHNGTGSVSYSFLSSIPTYYSNGTGGFLVRDTTFAAGTNVSLTVEQRAQAELAIQRFNEVANINMLPAGTGGGGPTTGTAITGNGTLVGGLGGEAGFGELVMPRNDDGYELVDISAVFSGGLNFFGNTYSSVYVNTNGNITFSNGLSTFTPFGISDSSLPIIAPFFGDVDTRTPSAVGSQSAPVYVDIDATRDIVTFTWNNVNYYNQNGTLQNDFQLQLYDRGGGNFDIVFRYQDINWTTGDASGGIGGLGGSIARAGFSAGDGSNFYELAASGNQSAMLGLDGAAGNTGTAGLWAFEVRNGTTGIGDITFGAQSFTDPGLFGFAYFPGAGDTNGDVWLNTANTLVANPTLYDEGWDTFIHELGHALGLGHPFDGTATLPTQLNNSLYTVMSYDPVPAQAGIADPAQQFPATPMLYDIQALQIMYGANMGTRAGNDTYFATGGVAGFGIANGQSLIATIWDAGGIDTFSGIDQTSAVTIDLRPGYFSTIGSIQNNVGIALGIAGTGARSADIENATGGSAGDTLIGNDLANVLDGQAGADAMTGGLGGDTYVVDVAGDTITELAGQGTDLVQSATISLNLASYANVENATLTGSLALNLTGSGAANTLIGNAGINVIDGGLGADAMLGGNGNDTYIVDVAGDIITETATGGADRVQSATISLNLASYANVEHATLTGSLALNLTGNGGGNSLIGNAGANVIVGGGGADNMSGGLGNDTYDVDIAGDVVNESATGGTDIVRSSTISLNLASYANVEIVYLLGALALNGTGNAGANTLYGSTNSAANVLTGLAGNDVYFVGAGDTIVEAVDGGTDTLYAGHASINLASFANVENVVLTGALAINAQGNGLANRLDGASNTAANVLTGYGGGDTYYLGAGDTVVEAAGGGTDTVVSSLVNVNISSLAHVENVTLTGALALAATGNAGNNALDGSGNATANALTGLAGNDTYIVGAGDTIVEAAGGGTDVVFSRLISLNLASFANVENVTLSGALALTATGNADANVLDGAGNTAANVLTGLAGNDTYFLGAGDTIVEAAGAAGGTDTLNASHASINLASFANVENVVLNGSLAINATGDGNANRLFGSTNSAANVLTGLAGNDTYYLGVGDTVVEAAGGGTDTIVSSALSINLANFANVENVTLAGTAAIFALGTSGDNALDGSANAAGNALTGLGGNDRYVVGAGDTVVEAAGGGTDTVYSALISLNLASYANVEHVWLIGAAALNATGSSGANNIWSNGGANTLTGLGGADTFYFNTALGASNIDTITDFSVADDTIGLENAVMGALTATGELAAQAFRIGAAAADADDRIVYNQATGALFYDANGNVAGGIQQIATLTTGLALTNADFLVI